MDIAVAGCGVAGLAAAALLATQGHKVIIFERFSQPAPVGSGLLLQPTGLRVLAQMGLSKQVGLLGHRIDRLLGRSQPTGKVALDVRFAWLKQDQFALAIHRSSLFHTLYAAVLATDAGIEPGRDIVGLDQRSGDRLCLMFDDGQNSAPFDLVIDALGARSPLARGPNRPLAYGALWATVERPGAASFDSHVLEQRYWRASKMVGVLPIGCLPDNRTQQLAFFWSLKAEAHESWRAKGLPAWKDEVMSLWPETEPVLTQITHAEQLTMARYNHRTLRSPVTSRVVHMGDSYHATSPQLGQGANMALLDALALARAFEHEKNTHAALQRYVQSRERHVRLYQSMSRLFTPVFQSDSHILPFLRDLLTDRLVKIPFVRTILSEMVAGTLGGPFQKLPCDDFPLNMQSVTPGVLGVE